MEKLHRSNVLVTSCLKTPVDPHTKAPLALYERERRHQHAVEDDRNNDGEVEHESDSASSDRGDFAPTQHRRPSNRGRGDPKELSSSKEEYCRRLKDLRRAHQQAMAELEEMYRNKLGIAAVWREESGAEGPRRRKADQNRTVAMCNLWKALSAEELNRTWGYSESYSSEEGVAENHTAVKKGVRTSPKERIRTMWQNFTVAELSPRDRPASSSSFESHSEGRVGGKRQRKKAGEEQETWRHRVTVPKPFRMTEREAERKQRKVKTRAELQLEDALLQKQLAELAECQRRFRASPVPAHVYLPLYQEMTARDQERRWKLSSQRPAAADSQPFSFLERERRKKEERMAVLQDLAPQPKRRTFRARPVPHWVYDSTVSDQMKEDQLYRAIKMQMRAQDLLRSASLPRSMLGTQRSAKSPELTVGGARTEADFRPRVSMEAPDFDGSCRRKQRQISQQDTKPTTNCEPFRLRTAGIASHRDRVLADILAEQASSSKGRWPYTAPTQTGHCSLSYSQELPNAKTTNSTRKRVEATRRVLEEKRKAEEEEEQRKRRQKRRERRLQRVVAKRAQANDPHTALPQASRAKLRQFRKQDLQRRKEHREEMLEIAGRVRERPLLLELVTQRNAKQAAERRYAHTLQRLGLSQDFVGSLAPKRREEPQCRAPHDPSAVARQDTQWYESGPVESPANDYSDHYEELGEQDLSGEEEGEQDLSGVEHGEQDHSGEEQGEQDLSGDEHGEQDLSGDEHGEQNVSGEEHGEQDLSSEEQGERDLSEDEHGEQDLSGED